MNILGFADPHIEESNIKELDVVFQEIYSHICPDDVIVCLGDYLDKKRSSAREIEFALDWIVKFSSNNKVYMLIGNHPYIDSNTSSIKYLKHYCEISEDLVLEDVYFAHKMTKHSEMFFGLDIPSKQKWVVDNEDELNKYRYVILGHQHSFQKLSNNSYHIGSIVYTDFSEAGHKGKYIFKIIEGQFDKIGLKIIPLKTVIPMKDINDWEELERTPKMTKVRYIFNSFNQLKDEIDFVNKFRDKFVTFKIKIDFKDIPNQTSTPKTSWKSFNDFIVEEIKKLTDIEVKEELIKEFNKILK